MIIACLFGTSAAGLSWEFFGSADAIFKRSYNCNLRATIADQGIAYIRENQHSARSPNDVPSSDASASQALKIPAYSLGIVTPSLSFLRPFCLSLQSGAIGGRSRGLPPHSPEVCKWNIYTFINHLSQIIFKIYNSSSLYIRDQSQGVNKRTVLSMVCRTRKTAYSAFRFIVRLVKACISQNLWWKPCTANRADGAE